jgi:hypothetical protein
MSIGNFRRGAARSEKVSRGGTPRVIEQAVAKLPNV